MNLDNLKIRPVHLAALLGLMPWVIANMLLTLVVNWPGSQELVSTLHLPDLQVVGAMNFYFCIYVLTVIVILILHRYIPYTALICHALIIFGFCVGIGIVYAVIYAVRGIVSTCISYAVILDSFLALYGLFMFYVDMFLRWRRPNSDNNSRSPVTTY